jgi:hypothetical protein
MIRIVTDNGEVPGFLRAVVLRNWIPVLVSALPVVGACFRLIDPAFLVFNNRKCVLGPWKGWSDMPANNRGRSLRIATELRK